MRLELVLLLVTLAVSSAAPPKPELKGQALVDFINKQGKWQAKLNKRFENANLEDIKALMGVKFDGADDSEVEIQPEPSAEEIADLPEHFDVLEKWPQCQEVIGNIADQSNCGSCWAVASASVMSDRLCIASEAKIKNLLSAADILSCCRFCGFGCNGGYPTSAFQYWKSNGVVTGSNYTQHSGCKPYPFLPCAHHVNSTHYPACSGSNKTPQCAKNCQNEYTTHPYKNDQSYGANVISFNGNIAGIQKELLENGPLVFTFHVYADFLTYKSGVYQHVYGSSLGGHAVRVVGWGTEDGTPYWKIANSWNEDWGDKGYFKIIRGKNECGIEAGITAGLVDLKRSHL